MSRNKTLSTLHALLFAGAAFFATVTVESTASAEVNQSFPVETMVDNPQAQPVIECGEELLQCGDDLCCERGDECCMPPNDVAYCAAIC